MNLFIQAQAKGFFQFPINLHKNHGFHDGDSLVGGFKYFLFSPLFGEDSQFD